MRRKKVEAWAGSHHGQGVGEAAIAALEMALDSALTPEEATRLVETARGSTTLAALEKP